MSLMICGINHKTALVALREKIFFTAEKQALYLHDLLTNGVATEAVLISTCNRSELYCETDDPKKATEWFCSFQEEARQSLYCYEGQQAVEHLMKVACGLDSMVLGEPEILGQVKTTFSESCAAGAIGPLFHRLFQHVFSIAKEIRSTTAIGACPVSIASTTISLAKSVCSFEQARVVLLGAGDMIELMLRYLQESPAQKMWVVNRQLEKARELAAIYGAEAQEFHTLSAVLSEANVLITATGSFEPIITAAFLKEVVRSRQEPLFIFDIAVPRDVEESAAALPLIKLYCIDDLMAIIQKHQISRQHAAEKAQEAIQIKAADFMAHMRSVDQVSHTIYAYRQQIEALCERELHKALHQLQNQKTIDHEATEKLLRYFANALTNKLLHAPSVQLRQQNFRIKPCCIARGTQTRRRLL